MYLCNANTVRQGKVQLSKARLSPNRSLDRITDRIKKKKPALRAGFNLN